jgi:dipeptidyl aminopeptidase/acylaminoacyl peptidase
MTEGTPPHQPGELNPEILASAGFISGLDVSPDGRFIAFGSTAGGLSQLFVQPLDGGQPVQITQGTERALQPHWSPSDDLIAYLQDIGGDENYQVYVIGADGGQARNLTVRPDAMHESISWSRDGTRIAYVSNRDGQLDVYYSDLADGQVHRVTDHPSVHHSPEYSPDGTMLAFASNRSQWRSNWDTFVASLPDGAERKVTQHQGEADEMSYYASQSPYWSPDGRRILVASSVPGNYDIMAIDVETLTQEWIADSPWDESNAQWSPDGSHVAYVVNEDGNLTIHVKKLTNGRSWPVSPPHGIAGHTGMRGFGGSYRWTPDGQRIVYSYSGPTQSGSIWVVPATGGQPRLLYSTLPAGLDRQQLVSPELIRYRSADGLQISAFLYRPRGTSGPFPAILMPHGGPTGQTLNAWSPPVQYLVSRGYAVLEPNFRGSTGYGTEFQWLNKNDWGGGDLLDVVAGANWLEENGISDRIGIAGGSYGGFMTLTAIGRYPNRWKAAVSLCGVVNLVTMYNAGRSDMRQFQARNIGTPEENPEFYRERSPLTFADNIGCPVLILQGERDPRVPLTEAEQMRDRLERAGKPCEYVVYEHEGHGFSRRANQIDSIRRMADFFDRYLRSNGTSR